jgi:hypothetical protein
VGGAEESLQATGIEVSTLEDLREAMGAIFRGYASCAIAVKAQHAYTRTLCWEERSDDQAAWALAAVLGRSEVNVATRLALGDWCWAPGSSSLSSTTTLLSSTPATTAAPGKCRSTGSERATCARYSPVTRTRGSC